MRPKNLLEPLVIVACIGLSGVSAVGILKTHSHLDQANFAMALLGFMSFLVYRWHRGNFRWLLLVVGICNLLLGWVTP